jgi:hypothetical protein
MRKIILVTVSCWLLAAGLNAQSEHYDKVLVFQQRGDTLIANDTAIHFIQIGDQTFEVKRTVSIVPAGPTSRLIFLNGSTTLPLGSGSGTIAVPGNITLIKKDE